MSLGQFFHGRRDDWVTSDVSQSWRTFCTHVKHGWFVESSAHKSCSKQEISFPNCLFFSFLDFWLRLGPCDLHFIITHIPTNILSLQHTLYIKRDALHLNQAAGKKSLKIPQSAPPCAPLHVPVTGAPQQAGYGWEFSDGALQPNFWSVRTQQTHQKH